MENTNCNCLENIINKVNLVQDFINGKLLDITKAECSRMNNENERIKNETTRQKAESNRITNENVRQEGYNKIVEQIDKYTENEKERLLNELERINNENKRLLLENCRKDSENIRKELESSRQTAETLRTTSEINRIENENNRIIAEDKRNIAELNRQQNELIRETQESTRLDNELIRKNLENSRVTAETSRVNAENSRVKAEILRVNAETERESLFSSIKANCETATTNANNAATSANTAAANAKADYIGTDNYVYHWDSESRTYKKTNLYVKGDKGDQGIQGEVGPKGSDGIGVPSGGNVGQYLKKKSNSDYDTEWSDVQGGGSGNVNSVNGKTGDVVLNANDVDALPANTEYQSPINDLESIRSGAQSGATAYQKPNTGIPSTDLSSAVQVSLRKADSALQTETDPTVPSWAKQSSKPTYTAQEVGALPDDTPLFSGDYNDLSNKPTIPTALSQLSEDSTHRVVSDAEKTTWNNKSNFSGSYNDLTDKPTIPDVPTNVSAFNNDAGYLTQHQNISGKEDVTTIVAPVNTTDATLPITTLTTEVGKYYRLDVAVETLTVTLPAITDLTTVRTVVIYLTGGTTPSITISTADSKDVYFQDGFEIKANSTYEINCLFNGVAWIVAAAKINVE